MTATKKEREMENASKVMMKVACLVARNNDLVARAGKR